MWRANLSVTDTQAREAAVDRDDRDIVPPEDADVIESDRVRREGDAARAGREHERSEGERVPREGDAQKAKRPNEPNPPHTTKHGITSPKFGSAGSGGAEYEPGPERD